MLGRGGYSVVFLAEDEKIGRRRVVVKILDQRVGDTGRFRERFRREIEILGRIDHPAIVAAHDCGELPGGQPFLVIDFVDGITLRERLRTPVGIQETAEIIRQLGAPLAAAHSQRIYHRDLKPENVMLQKGAEPGSWSVKLIDFGIAKAEQPGGSATTGLFVAGTAHYMAPEQFYSLASAATDIYALAAICCELLTGHTPFEQSAAAELGQLPKSVRPLIRKALSFDHRARPQDANQFACAVAEALNQGRGQRTRTAISIAASVAVLIASAVLLQPLTSFRSRPPLRLSQAVRLTGPDELALDPAVSPDGKWTAYASDRGSKGRTNIWIREAASGQTRRLTDDPDGADQPAFSPDGATLAYHSHGAIYAVPARGGAAVELVESGQRPRYSPDGALIAYTKGDIESGYSVGYTGWAGGGGEQGINRNCGSTAANPVWSSTGRFLLIWCKDSAGARETADFWAIPAASGAAIPTGASAVLSAEGIKPPMETQGSFIAEIWTDDRVIFAGRKGDQSGLWSLRLAEATGKAQGPAEFLDAGTADAYSASLSARNAGGRLLAFSKLAVNPDLWKLPLRPDGSAVPEAIERLTTDPATDRRASLSADGTTLVFLSDRSGRPSVWLKDMRTGTERPLTSGLNVRLAPRISPDGRRVVFTTEPNQDRIVWLVDTAPQARPKKVCTNCGHPRTWWPDNRHLLLDPMYDGHIFGGLFPVAFRDMNMGREVRISAGLYWIEPKVSPDGGWVVTGAYGSGPPPSERIFAIPLAKGADGAPVVPSSERWIAISDRSAYNNQPVWGADGSTIYFLSDCDGHTCIWGRRVDPATKQPIGASFTVYHSHDARLSIDNLGASVGVDPAAGPRELIFAQAQRAGSIWMAAVKP